MAEQERSRRGLVRFLPFAVAGLLAVGVGAVIASPWSVDEEPPATPREFYGITPQTRLEDEDFERMAAAGVGTVRIAFDWRSAQQRGGDCRGDRAEGVCNWVGTDLLVGAAAWHGIRVLPILGGARAYGPGDHATTEGQIQHPPTRGEDLEEWKDFVAAAVERYGPGGAFWDDYAEFGGDPLPVRTWQVSNEPNAEQYWPPEPDPEEYASLVAGTADAIRGVDSHAEVVLGGLFGTSAVTSSEFLRELYAVDGIEDDFDAIAIHPYSPNLHGIRVQVEWAREAAAAAGDDDVGIWVTELGWSSAQGDHPLEIGAEGQAAMIGRSLALLRKKRDAWDIRGVVLYTWQDRLDDEVCEFCREAGLFDESGDAKPAWDALTEATGGDAGDDAPLSSG